MCPLPNAEVGKKAQTEETLSSLPPPPALWLTPARSLYFAEAKPNVRIAMKTRDLPRPASSSLSTGWISCFFLPSLFHLIFQESVQGQLIQKAIPESYSRKLFKLVYYIRPMCTLIIILIIMVTILWPLQCKGCLHISCNIILITFLKQNLLSDL